jgi:hypothetical protein
MERNGAMASGRGYACYVLLMDALMDVLFEIMGS